MITMNKKMETDYNIIQGLALFSPPIIENNMENNTEHEMEALGFSSKGDITFWKRRNLIQDRATHNRCHHIRPMLS